MSASESLNDDLTVATVNLLQSKEILAYVYLLYSLDGLCTIIVLVALSPLCTPELLKAHRANICQKLSQRRPDERVQMG